MARHRRTIFGRIQKRLLERRIAQIRMSKVEWCLDQVAIEENEDTLAIGCGDGSPVEILHTMNPRGITCGVDVSEAELAQAHERNLPAVTAGEIFLYKTGGAHLPFDDQRFGLVCAFSCYVHWPDPVKNLREMYRVLKNGGTALVTAELHHDADRERHFRTPGILSLIFGTGSMSDLSTLEDEHHMKASAEDLKNWMESIGFENVTIETKDNWQCVIGGKV